MFNRSSSSSSSLFKILVLKKSYRTGEDDDVHHMSFEVVRSKDAEKVIKKREKEGYFRSYGWLTQGESPTCKTETLPTSITFNISGCLKPFEPLRERQNILEYDGKNECRKLIILEPNRCNTSGKCSVDFLCKAGRLLYQASYKDRRRSSFPLPSRESSEFRDQGLSGVNERSPSIKRHGFSSTVRRSLTDGGLSQNFHAHTPPVPEGKGLPHPASYAGLSGFQEHIASSPNRPKVRPSSPMQMQKTAGKDDQTYLTSDVYFDLGGQSKDPGLKAVSRSPGGGSDNLDGDLEIKDYSKVLSEKSLLYMLQQLDPSQCYCLVIGLGIPSAEVGHKVNDLTDKITGYHKLIINWKDSGTCRGEDRVFSDLMKELRNIKRNDIVDRFQKALNEGKELSGIGV